MTVLLFAGQHVAVVSLLILVSYGLGRSILRDLELRSTGEKIAFCASLGLGLIGTGIFLLGLVHLLYVGVVALAAILVVVGSVRAWREMASALREGFRELKNGETRKRAVRRVLFVCSAAAAIAPLAMLPLYPPHLWDAISYHLPAAKLYATGHAIVPAEYLRFCAFPQLNEMLFTVMLMVSDDLSAQFVQFAAMMLVAVLLYGWCGTRYSTMAGLWAAALWLSSPLVVTLAATAYIDVGLSLFCTVAIFACVNSMETEKDGAAWAALSGASAGFGAASKYPALVVVILLGTALLVRAIKRNGWRPFLVFTVCCVSVAGPWYLHNFHRTGNPVFPFMSGLFPNRACWNAADVALVAEEMRSHGGPRTLEAVLRFPYALAYESGRFMGPETPSRVLALTLPLFLVGAFRDRRSKLLGTVALAFFIFWFFSVQIFRYLLPVIPVMCALIVIAVDWLIRPLDRWRRHPAAIAIAGAAALLIMKPSYGIARTMLSFGPPPVTGREKELYHQRVPSYRCFQWLNHQYGSRYRVYTHGDEFMQYYADGLRIGDVVGPMRYSDVRFDDAEALYASLKSFGAEFMMAVDPRFMKVTEVQPYFRQHFQLVCGCANTRVWRLVEKTIPTELGTELVTNGGFDARAPGWMWVGPPSIHPGQGNGAAHVTGSQFPRQRISVSANQLHRLAFTAGGLGTRSQSVLLRWFDNDRELVARETQVFHIDGGESTAEMYVTSPPAAAQLRISLLPSSPGGTAVFDDVSLRPVLERGLSKDSENPQTGFPR